MNLTASNGSATGPAVPPTALEDTVSRTVTAMLLGAAINYVNGAMVHTFYKHHVFRTKPRYILFVHLVLNDMLMLSSSIGLLLLAYAFHTLSVWLCLLLLLPAILSTLNTPLNLLLMALECLVSVCYPLRHAALCSPGRTYGALGAVWAVSALSVLPDVALMLATEPPGFRTACRRDDVFRSGHSVSKRNASHILFLVLVWLALVYAYFRILFAAKAAESGARKARRTLLLHGFQVLLCMLVYVQPMLVRVLVLAFPGQVRLVYFVVFVVNQILPRLANPVVYGLRDATFRRYFRRHLGCTDAGRVRPHAVTAAGL